MERQSLTPEQQRAFTVFEAMLCHWQDYLITPDQLCVERICLKDTRISTQVPLKTKTLPRGVDWLWNQSRSRQNITSSNGTQVCFYKLNTRKVRKSETEAPPYKIWIFNVIFPNFQQVSFLWCERGEPVYHFEIEFGIEMDMTTEMNFENMSMNDSEIYHKKFSQALEEIIAPVSLTDLAFLRPFASPTCALLWS